MKEILRENVSNNLNLLLLHLKEELNIFQEKLIEETGIKSSSLWRWKNKERSISLANAKTLVNYFNDKLALRLTTEIFINEKITDIEEYRVDLDDWDEWRKLIEGMNAEQRRKFRDYLISLQ